MNKQDVVELRANLYTLLEILEGEVENIFSHPDKDELVKAKEAHICQLALAKIAWQINYLTVLQDYLDKITPIKEAEEFFLDCKESIDEDIAEKYRLDEIFDKEEIEKLFNMIFVKE